MAGRLEGRIALVIRGSRGIGRAIAEAMASPIRSRRCSPAVYLASEEASFTTRQVVPVDGGFLAS